MQWSYLQDIRYIIAVGRNRGLITRIGRAPLQRTDHPHGRDGLIGDGNFHSEHSMAWTIVSNDEAGTFVKICSRDEAEVKDAEPTRSIPFPILKFCLHFRFGLDDVADAIFWS